MFCQGDKTLTTTFKRPVANWLIADLPKTERDELLDHCELVELSRGEVLSTQYCSYSHAWFPLTAFMSVMTSVTEHPPMEIGMIGHEGMLGVTLLLAINQAPHQAIITGAGKALKINRVVFNDLLPGSPVLLQSLQHYCFQLMMQMAHTISCSHFHRVEARLACWLLMAHDRVDGDRFYLTHQSIADLLGVQRSAVTIASGTLKLGGLIDYSRGRISILDRRGLEKAAGDCYTSLIRPLDAEYSTQS